MTVLWLKITGRQMTRIEDNNSWWERALVAAHSRSAERKTERLAEGARLTHGQRCEQRELRSACHAHNPVRRHGIASPLLVPLRRYTCTLPECSDRVAISVSTVTNRMQRLCSRFLKVPSPTECSDCVAVFSKVPSPTECSDCVAVFSKHRHQQNAATV